jgi:hypothetical protein
MNDDQTDTLKKSCRYSDTFDVPTVIDSTSTDLRVNSGLPSVDAYDALRRDSLQGLQPKELQNWRTRKDWCYLDTRGSLQRLRVREFSAIRRSLASRMAFCRWADKLSDQSCRLELS